MRTLILLLALAAPATADTCPANKDHTAEQAPLFADLLKADNEMSGRIIGGRLWEIWNRAPNQKAQDMLNKGVARIRVGDYAGAEAQLNELVIYCPDYAEGYNQRAFAKFLSHNYEASLADLNETLAREPKHFGALAGRALVFTNMGRTGLGQAALKEALKVNPWLSERHMLVQDQEI